MADGIGMLPDSRTAAFQSGIEPTTGSPGLAAETAKWRQAVARNRRPAMKSYYPSSVLTAQSVVPSQSGYSAGDYSRLIPGGMLPSPNAMSMSTYRALNPIQFGTKLTI